MSNLLESDKIKQKLQNQYPNSDIEISLESEDGPYIKYKVKVNMNFTQMNYNPKFAETNPDACACGHSYERHFDPYEDWLAIGCKYCTCHTYHTLPNNTPLYEKIINEASFDYCQTNQLNYLMESYLIQHELFNDFEVSFSQYIGIHISNFDKLVSEKFQK